MNTNIDFKNQFNNEKYIIFNNESYGFSEHRDYHMCAVFVCLFYMEELDNYISYLKNIPESIDIYIISSNAEILIKCQNYNSKYYTIRKKNRGRDISALLVEVAKYVEQYEYICFLHDKKEKNPRLKKDTDIWKYGMWTNMIGTKNHIHKVVDFLDKNQQVGLLVPPAPVGEYYTGWFGPLWCNNYNNTVNLAKSLKLNVPIEENKNPTSIGTIFWARTKALKKLFERKWYYNDFVEEPLPDNGTLSHAIERVIGYVVEDSGYKVYYLLTNEYASWMFDFVCDGMHTMYEYLNNRFGIESIHELKVIDKQHYIIDEFCKKNKKVLLYGAGKYGKKLLERMKYWDLEPDGFVVSKKNSADLFEGKPIFEIDEIKEDKEVGIIISVNYEIQEEIIIELKKINFENYIIGYF